MNDMHARIYRMRASGMPLQNAHVHMREYAS